MTVNFFADEPGDFFETEEIDGSFGNRYFADDFFEGGYFDSYTEGGYFEDGYFEDDDDEDDDLTVDFAFDHDLDKPRLACIYTGGLWQLGIPELYLRPPRNHGSGDAASDARLAVFLATGLIHLGYSLLEADGFDVPPYWTTLNGRQVRFWLGNQEPPGERLARNLAPEVDTVIQVHCSLWHAPLLGNG
jgi:hypothetical protein